jgi:integrase
MRQPPRGFTVRPRGTRFSLRARIGGVRIRITGDSYDDLVDLAEELAQADTPEEAFLIIHRNDTLHDVFERWVVEHAPVTLTDSAGEDYIGAYGRYIEEGLGKVRVQLVRGRRLQRWAKGLPKVCGEATAHKVFATLSNILRFAAQEGIIPDNPMRTLVFPSYPKPPPRQRRAPTPTSVEYVLSLLTREDDRLLVELIAYEGLRQEEAIAVWRGAVRPVPGLLFVNQTVVKGRIAHIKNHRPHSVPLLESPRERLTSRLASMTDPRDEALLVCRQDGAPWGPSDRDSFASRFRRATKHVPGPDFTPHTLRAHYVTMMIESGTPPEVVADHIGDTVETVLRHYYLVRDDPDRVLPPNEQIARARARVAASPIFRPKGGRPRRRPEGA